MPDDHIDLYDGFSEWGWFQDSECVHLFVYMLLKARRRDGQYRNRKIKRGELVTSCEKLSTATGISERSIKTRIRRMCESGEIETRTIDTDKGRFGVVKIVNYGKYQRDPKASQKTKAANQETARQFKKPTIEEVQACIEERVAKGKPKVDAERFWNFYESKGWKVGNQPMKDWKAAVRTWENKNLREDYLNYE